MEVEKKLQRLFLNKPQLLHFGESSVRNIYTPILIKVVGESTRQDQWGAWVIMKILQFHACLARL